MSEISETEIKAMTKEQNYIRGYKDGKSDVLGKIRAEIKEESRFCPLTEGLERALEIIDKYTKESKELFEKIIPKYAEVDEIAQKIAEEYQKNLNNPYIFKPLANAIYKVWKEVDAKDQAKL